MTRTRRRVKVTFTPHPPPKLERRKKPTREGKMSRKKGRWVTPPNPAFHRRKYGVKLHRMHGETQQSDD